jgi:glycosyltransferase involved in cell wall biosynthesis
MHVLQTSTYDGHGGAARAAFRLFTGLKPLCDGNFVTRDKKSGDPDVSVLPCKQWSFFQKKRYQLGCLFRRPLSTLRTQPGFSVPAEDFLSGDLAKAIDSFQPDIVHLHWLCNQFLSLEDLGRIRQPVVWTLHDSWPFTGGCHVPGDCTAFRQQCGNCPVLGSGCSDDLSRYLHHRKHQGFSGINLTLVSPSRWLADRARESSLFSSSQIEVIPHGLDLTVFRPFERTVARRVLGLPEDGTLVLFGGMSSTRDSNKGYDLLVAALSAMTDRDWLSRTRLLVFGARKDERPEVRLPIPEHHLGYLNDDISLVMAYSAADVMVVPSRMEAFGQTAVEALACGTPVVCFGATGLIDIVDHLNSGYLAYPYDITDLARGILWATQPERRDVLRDRARQKAEQAFSLTTTAARYLDLYQSLCR